MSRNPVNEQNKKRTFDAEEMHWPVVDDTWTEAGLLAQDGMYRFAKVKHLLRLSTLDLTRISRSAVRSGTDTYKAFGFGKPKGSQYLLRMSRFRCFYRDYLARGGS